MYDTKCCFRNKREKIKLHKNPSEYWSIFLILGTFNLNAYGLEDMMSLYRLKKFKDVVQKIEGKMKSDAPLSYKEHILLITSYQKLNHLDGQIKSIRKAIKIFPKKDLLKRELANALESKADSYRKSESYDLLRKNLRMESNKVLNDLYSVNPTKENFTALIVYYNKKKSYTETVGLLELYGRNNFKGRVYYTYLCEAQYQLQLYSTSTETCGKLSLNFPKSSKGFFYYTKSLEKSGENETAKKNFSKAAGRFPASSEIQYEIGKALITDGKTEKGLNHLDKHLNIESTDEALVLKAETLFKLEKYDEALKVYILACKQHREPRRSLFIKLNAAARNFKKGTKMRLKFNREMNKCKYVYKPIKKHPKVLI